MLMEALRNNGKPWSMLADQRVLDSLMRAGRESNKLTGEEWLIDSDEYGEVLDIPRSLAWHGTEEEAYDLHAAMANNCAWPECEPDWIAKDCPVHGILDDQKTLDRLVFARRYAERLDDQEWME